MSAEKIFFLLLLTTAFFGCEKEPVRKNDPLGDTSGTGIFVCNEGNFQSGNASVTYVNYEKQIAVEDLYRSSNNSPVGDVLQSLIIFNGKAYLVVNNSGKLICADPGTLQKISELSGLRSPRYLLPLSDSKAYLSDLYENAISVVNLNAMKVSGKISCNGWTEEMLRYKSRVFVCNKKSNYVFVIDTASDAIVDSLDAGFGSESICMDQNKHVWVLSAGDQSKQINATLNCFDAENLGRLFRFNFKNNEVPMRLRINKSGDQIFFINTDVYSMDVSDSVPAKFITANGRNFYGLAWDPNHDELLVSDAGDYIQKGSVFRYDIQAMLKGKFGAGIIPGTFWFKP